MPIQSPTSSASPRSKISSAMSSFSLKKMKALVAPSTTTNNLQRQPSDADHSETSDTKPALRPKLHSNAQTMKHYALQRSDKIPLRAPGVFPANHNFSQQTIYLFESSEDEDDGNFWDDILHESPEPTITPDCDQEKKSRRASKQRSFHLPNSHYTDSKIKKFSMTAFPRRKSLSFHAPVKATVKEGESSLIRGIHSTSLAIKHVSDRFTSPKSSSINSNVQQSPSPATLEPYPVEKLQHRERKSPSQEQLLDNHQEKEDFSELSNATPESETASLIPDLSTTEVKCPRIDMILTSSPLFNNSNPTMSSLPTPASSTPSATNTPYGLPQFNKRFIFSNFTPQTHLGPDTPTTCVDSLSAPQEATPQGKFAMSTGSPGIFNFPTRGPHPLKSPLRQQYSLLSPHSIPSPLTARSGPTPPKTSRGPGAEMLATLEFLSELCQKSPRYPDEESDSLLDQTDSSIEDSHSP